MGLPPVVLAGVDAGGKSASQGKVTEEEAQDAPLQLMPRRELVHGRDTLLQRPLSEPRLRKLVPPQQIRVREVHRDLPLGRPGGLVPRVLERPEDAVLGADEVADELQVAEGVEGIVEDEDGGEGDFGEVGGLRRATRSGVSGQSLSEIGTGEPRRTLTYERAFSLSLP